MRNVLLGCTALVFFLACNSGTTQGHDGQTDVDSVLLPDSAHVFVVPAPLQISTYFLLRGEPEHREFLSSRSTDVARYSTTYQRAVNLGICLADAGYAALYNDRQLSLDYLARCESLIKQLRIDDAAAPYFMRLKSNLDNKDSLSFLLLKMFDHVQSSLNSNGEEKTAMYIMGGCFLENLSIVLQHDHLHGNGSYHQLLGQEKLWQDNLAEAITYLDPDSATQDLYNTIFTLQEYSKDVTVQKKDGNKLDCELTHDHLVRWRDKTLKLRNDFVTSIAI